MSQLPPYSVRVSSRAKRVRLQVVPPGRIEVVVPRRFNQKHIPGFVAEHRDWLQRQLQAMADHYGEPGLPEQIELAALAESWSVERQVGHGRVQRMAGQQLRLTCVDESQGRALLQGWLHNRARQVLPAWLTEISKELGLPFKRVAIRAQRTRWGSCSSSHNINLNRAMLFLEPQTVRYLMIHELCHTVHLNHSPAFWNLVAQRMPEYAAIDRSLRRAMHQIPHWAIPER